jgi:hypothetical protein
MEQKQHDRVKKARGYAVCNGEVSEPAKFPADGVLSDYAHAVHAVGEWIPLLRGCRHIGGFNVIFSMDRSRAHFRFHRQ